MENSSLSAKLEFLNSCPNNWGMITRSIAQMGIGTLNPNPRSILELKSTPGKGRGLLIPRMSTSIRRGMEIGTDSVGVPLGTTHNSLLLFDNTQYLYYSYNNTSPIVTSPVNYNATGTIAEDARVWQIVNPWKTQYAWDGNRQLVNLIQDTAATGFVGIGWVDYTESPTFPLHVKGDGFFEAGNLTVDKTIDAETVKADTVGEDNRTLLFGYGSVPVGTVLTWSGEWDADVEAIMLSKGWVLCDDRLRQYTDVKGRMKTVPDLRGRFIVGFDTGDPDYDFIGDIGPDYGDTAGVNRSEFFAIEDYGKRIKLKEPAMPRHKHNVQDQGHDHGGGAEHTHDFVFPTSTGRTGPNVGFQFLNANMSTGSRTYTSEPSRANIPEDRANLSQDRRGGFTFPPTSSRRGEIDNAMGVENRPPYYVLAYIIRIR